MCKLICNLAGECNFEKCLHRVEHEPLASDKAGTEMYCYIVKKPVKCEPKSGGEA